MQCCLNSFRWQFHKRYSGYKVPAAHLRSQRWSKLLRAVQSTSPDSVAVSTEEDIAEASSLASDICDVEEGDDDAEVHESEQTTEVKTRRKRRTGRGMASTEFILLTDLLPPVPKKGNFDVETIKRSQYFFS
jgi:DNA-directed RNA polymerase